MNEMEMHMETPTISAASYASRPVNLGAFQAGSGMQALDRRVQQNVVNSLAQPLPVATLPFPASNKQENKPMSRRLVQVFIADPNENVPLEQSLLYSGEQKLTDATDQELFFELDLKNVLEQHNAKRVKLVDKKVRDRTEYLEPAKIRDLKMTVVTIATF